MEEFYIENLDDLILKVQFHTVRETGTIKYSGRVFAGETNPFKESEGLLAFSFSFSRQKDDWSSIKDFSLKSDMEEVQSQERSFEPVIIAGIKGLQTGEPFEMMYEPDLE